MLVFPPCTHLAVSGARWWEGKRKEQFQALRFVADLLDADIPRIALENPIGTIGPTIRPPDQIIQPWQFGHGETKATCLWLKNLPALLPTRIVEGRAARVHREPPSPERWKNRSRTLQGIADAMANQWGALLKQKAVAALRAPVNCGARARKIFSGWGGGTCAPNPQPGEAAMPRTKKQIRKSRRSKATTTKTNREPRPCACGCGKQTSGSDFRMGHDMRLRGIIKRGETLKPESVAFLATRKSDPHYAPPKKAGV
jgi:hypothetical protein